MYVDEETDEDGSTIKLITPGYFDKDLDLTFKTLSQGGAGDVYISSAIDRSVQIDLLTVLKSLEDPGNIVGVEDGATIKVISKSCGRMRVKT